MDADKRDFDSHRAGYPGLLLINRERVRQVAEKGWTAAHDASRHADGELAEAAAVYASRRAIYVKVNHTTVRGAAPGTPVTFMGTPVTFMGSWPRDWDFKGTSKADGYGLARDTLPEVAVEDRIRELSKAGALIAAELDRLLAPTVE